VDYRYVPHIKVGNVLRLKECMDKATGKKLQEDLQEVVFSGF